MSQLGDLANIVVGPLLKLVGSTAPPYLYQSITLGRHCKKLLEYKYIANEYCDIAIIEKAINSSQLAIGEAINVSSTAYEPSKSPHVDNLFKTARESIKALYMAMHSRRLALAQKLGDCFVHECDDAYYRDIQACYRKQVILKRTKPTASELTDAMKKTTMDVTISVSKKVLVCGRGTPGRYHGALRLQGLIYKLDQEKAINMLTDTLKFYLRREKQHTLTANGAIFEAVGQGEVLTSVRKSATTALNGSLELFLAVAPLHQPLAIITAGYERNHKQLDVGEVVVKPNDKNSPLPHWFGKRGDVYRSTKSKTLINYEDMRWEDLTRGPWVLAFRERPGDDPFAMLETLEPERPRIPPAGGASYPQSYASTQPVRVAESTFSLQTTTMPSLTKETPIYQQPDASRPHISAQPARMVESTTSFYTATARSSSQEKLTYPQPSTAVTTPRTSGFPTASPPPPEDNLVWSPSTGASMPPPIESGGGGNLPLRPLKPDLSASILVSNPHTIPRLHPASPPVAQQIGVLSGVPSRAMPGINYPSPLTLQNSPRGPSGILAPPLTPDVVDGSSVAGTQVPSGTRSGRAPGAGPFERSASRGPGTTTPYPVSAPPAAHQQGPSRDTGRRASLEAGTSQSPPAIDTPQTPQVVAALPPSPPALQTRPVTPEVAPAPNLKLVWSWRGWIRETVKAVLG
ncbi:hypothetical protein FRB97_002135 [Tulasnella sp. 331]|nr:hypothetical protein FRB97_002135 [Tulasnella sp. 331]